MKEDVFNPDNYGEEEFGPDDPKAKVKKTRKKKKVTKTMFFFLLVQPQMKVTIHNHR